MSRFIHGFGIAVRERKGEREREREIISLITISSFEIAIGPRLFFFFFGTAFRR